MCRARRGFATFQAWSQQRDTLQGRHAQAGTFGMGDIAASLHRKGPGPSVTELLPQENHFCLDSHSSCWVESELVFSLCWGKFCHQLTQSIARCRYFYFSWRQGQGEQFLGLSLRVLAALSHRDSRCSHFRMRESSGTQEGLEDLMPSEGPLHFPVIFPTRVVCRCPHPIHPRP